jgi:acetyl esterase/lipase
MESVRVRKDLVYKTDPGSDFRFVMDLYNPEDAGSGAPLPAVVLVHGEWSPEILPHSKDLGSYVSWGQLLAASGLVAVNFNHRTTQRFIRAAEAACDVDDLLEYVRGNEQELGIDRDRLCIWAFSAGVPVGMRSAMHGERDYVRCIVAYYGPMDIRPARKSLPHEVSDETLRDFSAAHYLESKPQALPPILIARAGLDNPRINESIDRFVKDAAARGVSVEMMDHPRGQHGFDVLDDDDRTRVIVQRTLEFVKDHI